jgi:tetratricopeptide (TPR) repeat protein
VGITAGKELRVHGHPEAARPVFERTIRCFESHPPTEADRMMDQRHLGEALYGAERWEDAAAVFRALLEEYPENLRFWLYNPQTSAMMAMSWVARSAAHMGDTATARELDAQIAGMEWGEGAWRHLYERARLAAVLGRSDDAVELLRQALSSGMRFGLGLTRGPHREPDFVSLHGRQGYQELMRPKG